jgi:Predicted membrane protein
MANNYCSNCGAQTENTNFCPNCGESYSDEKQQKNREQYSQANQVRCEPVQSRADSYNPYIVKQKSPFLAFILSFFWTGLGQLYNGKFVKGIFFQIALAIGLSMLIVPGIFVWIFGLWDAYNDSEKMNRGEIPFDEPTFGMILGFIFFWVIVLIALAFIVMLLSTLFMIPFMFI